METPKVDGDQDKRVITTVVKNTVHIPLDLTIEILTRLPAKSLFKFSCVSKQWRSVIRSRSFTDSFMSFSLPRPRFLLGCNIEHNNMSGFRFFSSPLPPQGSNHSLSSVASIHNMPVSSVNPCTYTQLCNSVRGILCVRMSARAFLLCNPTTRQVLWIPDDSAVVNTLYRRMYLGYNPSNDQYKILFMAMSQDKAVLHSSVCTLERGDQQSSFSSWRHLESKRIFLDYGCLSQNPVCIDGVLYYVAHQEPWEGYVIVSFDVGSERLLVIKAPNEGEFGHLLNYQGKLACFRLSFDPNTYSLWVLKDLKEQIWSTKTVVFTPPLLDLHRNLELAVCATTDAGEIVFMPVLNNGTRWSIKTVVNIFSSRDEYPHLWLRVHATTSTGRLTSYPVTIGDSFELFYYDLKKNNVRRRVKVAGITGNEELSGSSFVSYDHVDNIISF